MASKKKRRSRKKWKPTILFDDNTPPLSGEFDEDSSCLHLNAASVDDKAFIHWCPDCGSIQTKPGAKWKAPRG